ncbi:MAG: hypothetical protein MJE68_07715, partial [Proteobacteria bacterium]|nr:hypothetical protein [Pseudomonadota bacterium]
QDRNILCGQLDCSVNLPYYNYSRKIWSGIKVGGLAVYFKTAKLKSTKISCSHACINGWRSHTEPPNLNLLIFLQ